MSESFAKLFSSITDSTIWAEDGDTCKVWVTMLAMAERDGYVGASIPGIANRARVSVETAAAAIAKFMAPDPYSRSKEHDGRRVEVADRGFMLLNYAKFRDLRDQEARRETNRKAQAEHRARKAASASKADCQQSKPPSAHAEVDVEAESEAEKERERARESAAAPLALTGEPANETERRKKPRDSAKAELRKAVAELAAEFGHEATPTASLRHWSEGAAKVASLVKSGSEVKQAAAKVARCSLQWLREARSSTFGFSLQDCIVGAAATSQTPLRNGRVLAAHGTTEVDFANVPSIDEQLAAHARAEAEGAAERAKAKTYSFEELLAEHKKAGSHV